MKFYAIFCFGSLSLAGATCSYSSISKVCGETNSGHFREESWPHKITFSLFYSMSLQFVCLVCGDDEKCIINTNNKKKRVFLYSESSRVTSSDSVSCRIT